MRFFRLRPLWAIGLLALTGCAVSPAPDAEPAASPDPERVTASTWVFETVADQPLPDRVRVTMGFDAEEGRVFGRAGCNRYTAGYTLDGESLRISVVAATKMMCPEAVMVVEDRFLKALDGLRQVRLDDATDRLELTGVDGERSRAFPASEGEQD